MSENQKHYHPDPPTEPPSGPPPPPPPGPAARRSHLTPTQCPKCEQDLAIALRRWWEVIIPMCTRFEFVCPNCNTLMVVDVELQPWFYIQKGGEG